jgi:hypothetical protein
VGIIVLATRAPGRSAASVSWQSRAAHAYEKGGALDGAVRATEREGAFLERDGPRWHDIQRRADDLTEALYSLRETALTEERRAQVADALASLQSVRYAMDAQRGPGGAGAQQSGALHSRLLALESSLNAFRMPGDRLR